MDWQPIESAPKDGRDWRVASDGYVSVDGSERHQYESDKGYRKVTMGGRSVSVHRLVASAFVPNPRGHPEVNHKNGDKGDNRAANLEWCTRSHNMKHAYSSGLHPGVTLRGEQNPNWGRRGRKHSQSMAVRATFADGTVRDFESQLLAERDGFIATKISDCINGRRKSHRAATWMPLPDPPKETIGGDD